MLRGAIAAAVTPLRDEGAALDEEAFGPYLDFLAAAGLDGILALGTTGEGILLSAAERRRAAELFVDGLLPAIVHCGAQTTAETCALAEHAAGAGAA
ncbi:MAG TPA: dihydrodipicolinate synthase family protein, partial [Gaiellaceae bacterium]|nr:dihydrodipicolinate synthase family protein [Gaiellaceae bacterium]